jgi:hypothetical protein
MISMSHFVLLSTIFVIIISLSFSDTASLSCHDMLHNSSDYYRVNIRQTCPLNNLCGRCWCTGVHELFSYASGACGSWCSGSWNNLLCRTALVRWTQRRTSSQRIPWEFLVLFSFPGLLSRVGSLDITLDEVSLLPLGCKCSRSA